VIRPLEALLRIALAAEEVRLERRIVGDARHAVELALVRNGIDRLGRRVDGDQVDLVLQDELARHVGRTVGVGLAVADQDLVRVLGPVQIDRRSDLLLDLSEHERHVLGEERERTGGGLHEPDLDRARRGERYARCRDRESGGGAGS
jgi:hypothetical protein